MTKKLFNWEQYLSPGMAEALEAYRKTYEMNYGGDSHAFFANAYASNYPDYLEELEEAQTPEELAEVYACLEMMSYPFRLGFD